MFACDVNILDPYETCALRNRTNSSEKLEF